MKINTDRAYLLLPVNDDAPKGRALFTSHGKLVYDLTVSVDSESPAYNEVIPLGRFGGEELEMTLIGNGGEELCCPEPLYSDDNGINGDIYRHNDRPFVHFTAAHGWINDPNGLVWQNGRYHMFFQHNPVSVQWGNMHWGHAVSEDLLHWRESDDALFPNEYETVYSGSAVIDREGRAGLGQGAMLLYYTAAGGNNLMSQGRPFTQCLAYSRDGGATFENYASNPVIAHIEAENRDPKVVWAEELQAYLLALYLNDDRYALFKSNDLLHFERLQTLSLTGDNECPDIYPIIADDGSRRWVFSGAHHRYFTGAMTETGFVADGEAKSLHFGGNSYASQTFSDIPDGRRVNIAWNTIQMDSRDFNSQMSIPTEYSLKKLGGEYYLCAEPLRELAALISDRSECEFSDELQMDVARDSAYYISLELDKSAGRTEFSLFGVTFTVDIPAKTLRFGDKTVPLYQ